MILFVTSFVLLLSCLSCDAQVDLTVLTCSENEVKYKVTNGVVNGISFVDGTTLNVAACTYTLTGDEATDTFIIHYATCGIDTSAALANQIEFVILVQELSIVNTEIDKRYKVTCTFSESTVTINTQLMTSLTDPKHYTAKPFTITPPPRMFLVNLVDDTNVGSTDVLALGHDVRLHIKMQNEIAGYQLIATECSILAQNEAGTQSSSNVDLLENKCAKYENLFPSFEYGSYQVADSAGNQHDIPELTSTFKIFFPTFPYVSLARYRASITIFCTVRVCYDTVADCVAPTCDPTRKKRQDTEDDVWTNSSTYDLKTQFRIALDQESATNIDNDVTSVHVGGNDDICMDSTSFYGMLLSLLALLIAAWAILFCFCVCARRRRRRVTSKTTTLVDNTSTRISASTPVINDIMTKPVKTIPMALPRYFPAESVSYVTADST